MALEKNLSQCTINPTQTDLTLNLGLCSEKTASNYLGHHTVFYFLLM
jgi:hypothetical protein